MRSYLYSFYDTELGIYEPLQHQAMSPETMTEILKRDIKKSVIPDQIKGKKLYFFGTFDDEEGKITTCQPEYIITMPERSKKDEA